MKPVRFFIFTFLLSTFSFLLSPTPARAQSPAVTGDSHYYTQQVLLDLSSALTCQLVGIDPSGPDPATLQQGSGQAGEPKRCLGYDITGKLSFFPSPLTSPSTGSGQAGGAVGTMGNLIAVLYTPPASTGDYFRYLAGNFGVVKPAYAQGTGFSGLSPLIGVWTVFRNLAYVLFVIAFVVVGVAVMLRIRLDPRTVMTIQNQIPKLIIGLLLVTFSYAIAGFLIDMMWVVIYLFIEIGGRASPSLAADIAKISQATDPFDLANKIGGAGGNIGGLGAIVGAAGGSVGEIASKVFDNPVGQGFFGLIGAIIGAVLGGRLAGAFSSIPFVGSLIGFVVGAAATAVTATQLAKFLIGAIALLIIAIAVLWALFRLWFALIQAYVFILIDVVFAPLWILSGILPGGLGVGAWLRDIAANLSAFPTTVAMFLLGRIFIEGFQKIPGGFTPPLIGPAFNPTILSSFIGLGIILMTPQVVTMVRDFFKAPKFNLAPIGQAVGVGTGTLQAPVRPVITGFAWLAGQKVAQKIFPGLKP